MEKDSYYVERCLDGHPDDFRHLVRRYQPVLLAHLAGKPRAARGVHRPGMPLCATPITRCIAC